MDWRKAKDIAVKKNIVIQREGTSTTTPSQENVDLYVTKVMAVMPINFTAGKNAGTHVEVSY